jgi:hypothetical protein
MAEKVELKKYVVIGRKYRFDGKWLVTGSVFETDRELDSHLIQEIGKPAPLPKGIILPQ